MQTCEIDQMESEIKDFGVDKTKTLSMNESYQVANRKRRLPRDICVECGVERTNVVSMPCRHMMLCTRCARTTTWCPDCSTNIDEYIEINKDHST